MTTRESQDQRYWLTPKGCAATGGHAPDEHDTCKHCGAHTTPERNPA